MSAKNDGQTLGFEKTRWRAVQVQLEVPFRHFKFWRIQNPDA